jgi:4a-hydroxytetrahydrobiopterin dehydratase
MESAQHALTQRAISAQWSVGEEGRSLNAEWRFPGFAQAFGFMAEMALVSERMNHHPEWFNVYDRVRVRLSTHDAGGLTNLDLDWAESATRAAVRHGI